MGPSVKQTNKEMKSLTLQKDAEMSCLTDKNAIQLSVHKK